MGPFLTEGEGQRASPTGHIGFCGGLPVAESTAGPTRVPGVTVRPHDSAAQRPASHLPEAPLSAGAQTTPSPTPRPAEGGWGPPRRPRAPPRASLRPPTPASRPSLWRADPEGTLTTQKALAGPSVRCQAARTSPAVGEEVAGVMGPWKSWGPCPDPTVATGGSIPARSAAWILRSRPCRGSGMRLAGRSARPRLPQGRERQRLPAGRPGLSSHLPEGSFPRQLSDGAASTPVPGVFLSPGYEEDE